VLSKDERGRERRECGQRTVQNGRRRRHKRWLPSAKGPSTSHCARGTLPAGGRRSSPRPPSARTEADSSKKPILREGLICDERGSLLHMPRLVGSNAKSSVRSAVCVPSCGSFHVHRPLSSLPRPTKGHSATRSLRVAAVAGCAALVLAGGTACVDSPMGAFDYGEPVFADTGESFIDVMSEADLGSSDSAPVCEGIDPTLDSDGDGLLDIIEDRNLNCRVDADETDPFNPDTDGDGLLDGEEDVNQNGVADLDRGEFDPRLYDTDGNGIPDSEEPEAPVCRSSLPRSFAGHRVALGTDRVYFVDPSIRISPLVEGGAILVASPDTGEAALLAQAGVVQLGPANIVDVLQAGMVSLGGRISTLEEASRALGTRWTATYQLEFPVAMDARAVLEPLGALLGLDRSMLQNESWATSRRFRLRIIAELDADPTHRGRVSVSVSPSVVAEDWFGRTNLATISPPGMPFVRTRCERLEAERSDDLDLVIVVDSTAVAAPARDAAAQALFQLIELRARAGLTTRTTIVRADAHLDGLAGESVLDSTVVSASVARDALLQVEEEGMGEQRLWFNANAALERIQDRDAAEAAEGRRRLLLLVASREDSDFRESARGLPPGPGRLPTPPRSDGPEWSDSEPPSEDSGAPDPVDLPLPPDDDRAAVTEYWVRKLGAFADTDIVAVAPASIRGTADDCVGLLATGLLDAELGAALSFRDVAVRAGGSFMELCNPDLEAALVGLSGRLAGADGAVLLRDNPIPSTLRVAVEGDVLDGGLIGLQRIDAERTELRVRRDGALPLVGVAYMHWEGTAASERGTTP
jgi:hypothetical protein